ncbi:group 1 glycosyl transferase [[Clostridium] sordellii]|uniref:glycosyltransferase family 4 protein n=1 Tax=Paraclostridium sordellii TaxID=1505 RepID=UPI0005422BA6|nr:glycosyltransferase family 4 protein [Paeniclostridium sordellii]CEK31588.1 group 1 glycosyl transferase [[Clostridium] sordellii] [Paeniclostridium sordellii]
MKLGIVRLYTGESGKIGYYNLQEVGLAKELVKNIDMEVLIFILRKKDKYPQKEVIQVEENIKIVYLPVRSIVNHGLLNPKELEKFKLDLIQLNADNQIGCYKVMKWALKNDIPIYNYIGTIDSDSSNRLKRAVSRIIVKRNYKIMKVVMNVTKTPEVFNKLKELGISNLEIIPVGLDIENFQNISSYSSEILKDKYKLPKYKNILVFVGRLEEYKKPFIILELLEYIKNIEDKYHLLVVGDGSLKNQFLEFIDKNNLIDNVTYIEQIEHKYMAEIYSVADIFINTNDKEIYGMSILEAMFCGCPVLAKEAPGPTFIIDNGKTGYVIKNYDKHIWYEKINYIISNRDQFSNNSKARIENDFLWSEISIKYKKLFNKIGVE